MRTSKELLDRIAALRTRLDRVHVGPGNAANTTPTVATPHAFEARQSSESMPTGVRLTSRAARLLRDAREVLTELKALADHPQVAEESSPLAPLHRESATLLDVLLRNLVSLPVEASAQMRFCEGLGVCLRTVTDRLGMIKHAVDAREREAGRLRDVASIMRLLVAGNPVGPEKLVEIAQGIIQDVERRLPLRFAPASGPDAVSIAASHGLTVAQVLARVLRPECPDRTRLAERIAPALVHDIGMAALPIDLLRKPGPLDDAERALVHSHPLQGARLLGQLWPAGGWPVELAGDHHERLDGSGYPSGKGAYELSEPVRLLAVCDVYAALVSTRAHRPALDPRTALADVLKMGEEGILDRGQAEKLLRLTFYPAGCVVLLSDGSIGVVTGPSRVTLNPAKATVIRLRGPQGEPPTQPWPLDLADWATLGIVRALTPYERSQALCRSHPLLV